MCMCVFVRLFVCLFGCVLIRVSLCFLGWLVGCLCLYVLVCFLALFSTISCFTNTFGDRVVLFLHFGGPWGSIVTPGAPFCHPWWKMQRVFSAWRDLEAQFVDPWAPCGPPWNPFWCLFTALGPDPGPLLRLFCKRLEKGTQKDRKRELEWMHSHWIFNFFQKIEKCVPTAPARAD